MFKGIAECVSPELLMALHQMGHGDETVLADAHFPGHAIGRRVLRADGHKIAKLLDGILPLFELDSYSTPLTMMDVVPGDVLDSGVEADYVAVVRRHAPSAPVPMRTERFEFYEQAKNAFAVVMTGEMRKYGNLILKKGVTPIK